MRAVLIREFGPPSVLTVVRDQPRPVRRPGEVLVDIHCTSVNPVDWKTRKGDAPRLLCALPKVLGGDVAGIVREADAGSAWQPGDKVFSCTDGFKLWRPEGAYAEQMAIPESQLAAMPKNTSFEQAGALPLVSLTAWQALEAAALQPGQRVLIHAGAGGVGSIALQLAKARGLHVTTTCSTRNIAFCKEIGADEVVDYTEQRFEDVYQSKPFDGVIDAIGGDYESRSLAVLKRNGVFVSILNSGLAKKHSKLVAGVLTLWGLVKGKLLSALQLGPRYHLLIVEPNGEQLAAVGRLVEEGKVKPIIDSVLPLERASEAHEYLEQEHARGKVVLRVKDAE